MRPPARMWIFPLLLLAAVCVAQTEPATSSVPLDEWKNVLLSGDAASLRAMYSVQPAARVLAPGGETDAEEDLAFWTGLKIKSMDLDIIQSVTPQPDTEQVVFNAKLVSAADGASQVLYITAGQFWQKQGERWRLLATKRSETTRLQMPNSVKEDLYPEDADAHAEIKQALARAAKAHKRVLVVFGANWCYDCHVLDLAFHRDDLAPVLAKNYEVVHVDIGQGNKNLDLMKQYQVPVEKGVPALAVLDQEGNLLFSQKSGEFERARALDPETLLAFLNKWKPQPS